MSILVDGWPIVATLQDLVSSLDTTMMPTYRRRIVCLQNTQHLNFRHTTPNKPINTNSYISMAHSKRFLHLHELFPLMKGQVRWDDITSQIIRKICEPWDQVLGGSQYMLIRESIINLRIFTQLSHCFIF